MNGLDKLAGAREIRFVKYMNIPDSQLTEFLVNIKKEDAQRPVNAESANSASVRPTEPNAKADS